MGSMAPWQMGHTFSSMVSNEPDPILVPREPEGAEEEEVPVSRAATPPSERPTRLATVEERLLRLQPDFTQLAPDLLHTTTGLYQLKDSVGRIKRWLRARQAKYRSQNQQLTTFPFSASNLCGRCYGIACNVICLYYFLCDTTSLFIAGLMHFLTTLVLFLNMAVSYVFSML